MFNNIPQIFGANLTTIEIQNERIETKQLTYIRMKANSTAGQIFLNKEPLSLD